MLTHSVIAKHLSDGFPAFKIAPIYDAYTDSFMIYAKDTPSFSRRHNERFTFFLDAKDESLVGFEIKGFKRLIERKREFDLEVTRSTVSLKDSVALAVIPDGDQNEQDLTGMTLKKIRMFLREEGLEEKDICTDDMQLCT